MNTQEITSEQQNNLQAVQNITTSTGPIQFDGATLQKMYEDSEKAKRTSGIAIIFWITLITIGVNVLNSLFFRNSEITKYSIIFFFVFFIPTLMTKFGLLNLLIVKFAPFLKEPDDFLKRVRD